MAATINHPSKSLNSFLFGISLAIAVGAGLGEINWYLVLWSGILMGLASKINRSSQH